MGHLLDFSSLHECMTLRAEPVPWEAQSAKLSGKLWVSLTVESITYWYERHVYSDFHSGDHSVNNKPVKRLSSVARLPPAFYSGPHAGWYYGIVTPFL